MVKCRDPIRGRLAIVTGTIGKAKPVWLFTWWRPRPPQPAQGQPVAVGLAPGCTRGRIRDKRIPGIQIASRAIQRRILVRSYRRVSNYYENDLLTRCRLDDMFSSDI